VLVQPAASADNVTLPHLVLSAGACCGALLLSDGACCTALSIDISCLQGAQQ